MTNEFDIDLRLDEEFLFIFKFSKDIFQNFIDRPQENELFQQWLAKLCMEKVEGLSAKRLRNTYLVRLLSCLREAKLTEPFLKPPNDGPLEPLSVMEIVDKEPPWLKQLIAESQRGESRNKSKDCRVYLNTKVFEGNRGACAYLAMSVADEGDIPHWVQIGDDGSKFEKHLDQIFQQLSVSRHGESFAWQMSGNEEVKFRELKQYLIDCIGAELSEQVGRQTDAQVERILERYVDYIQGTALAGEARRLPKNRQREFLLSHLRSELINNL